MYRRGDRDRPMASSRRVLMYRCGDRDRPMASSHSKLLEGLRQIATESSPTHPPTMQVVIVHAPLPCPALLCSVNLKGGIGIRSFLTLSVSLSLSLSLSLSPLFLSRFLPLSLSLSLSPSLERQQQQQQCWAPGKVLDSC